MNYFGILKVIQHVQRSIVRDYAFKSDLKIKWVRPEKISCIKPEKSGDIEKLSPLSPDEFLVHYEKSEELKTADPTVQSVFKLESNRGVETSNYYREKYIKRVQRHALDYGSMEAKLANMTATIRCYQDHMETFTRDVHTKVKLKELIDKRKKFLKYLRRWDYARFEWILEKLDLVYKPPPAHFHWITRKESLQKLTDTYCQNIQDKRLLEYRKKLENEQIAFLEESITKMKFVRKEQIDCDVPVTVTENQIADMQRELDLLKENAASAALLLEKQKQEMI